MSLNHLAPVGWRVTAQCVWCGHTRACWGDGRMLLCRGCFCDVNGFDPAVCEWGEAK